jgi:hypothetical protein
VIGDYGWLRIVESKFFDSQQLPLSSRQVDLQSEISDLHLTRVAMAAAAAGKI